MKKIIYKTKLRISSDNIWSQKKSLHRSTGRSVSVDRSDFGFQHFRLQCTMTQRGHLSQDFKSKILLRFQI